MLKKYGKKISFIALFFAFFFSLPLLVEAEEVICTYQKNVYPSKGAKIYNIKLEARGNPDATNTGSILSNVKITDNMGDIGFGANGLEAVGHGAGRYFNYDKNLNTWTTNFTGSIFNDRVFAEITYLVWVDNPDSWSGGTKLCPPYVVAFVGPHYFNADTEDLALFSWVTSSYKDAKWLFERVRYLANKGYGYDCSDREVDGEKISVCDKPHGISSSLSDDDSYNKREYLFDAEKKFNQYLEILPLYVKHTKETATTADNVMKTLATKIEDDFYKLDDNNCETIDSTNASVCGTPKGDAQAYLIGAEVKVSNAGLFEIESALTTKDARPGYEKLKELIAIASSIGLTGHYREWNTSNDELEQAVEDYNDAGCQQDDRQDDEDCIELQKKVNDAQTKVNNLGKTYNVPSEYLKELFTGLKLNPQPIDCSSFLGEDNRDFIKEIYTILQIAAPILVIVFGSLDFARATAAGEPDALKKAGNNFLKRVIAAVLLFIIPLFVRILLDVAHVWGTAPTPKICVYDNK